MISYLVSYEFFRVITLTWVCRICSDLLVEILKVTVEDVRFVIREYLSKLFDPDSCWYALAAHGKDKDKLVERLQQHGFKFAEEHLAEICTTL